VSLTFINNCQRCISFSQSLAQPRRRHPVKQQQYQRLFIRQVIEQDGRAVDMIKGNIEIALISRGANPSPERV